MSSTADRFAQEAKEERDPERREVLAAAARLLRREPVRVPSDGRLDTVKALAAEAGLGRFAFAHPERGKHYALGRRYLEAASDPAAEHVVEARLREQNADLVRTKAGLALELARATRTVELLARANRVLTIENDTLRQNAARGGGRIRAVPDPPR